MKEIFLYFLKLGATGFGGPLAVIAQLHQDLVLEKKWISQDEFRSLFGLIKAMPGPVAFQMGVALAYRRAGFQAAAAAAVGFVLPAFLMIILIAIFYDQVSAIPWVHAVFLGMQLGAFALIAWALRALTKDYFKEILFWICALSAIFLCALTPIPEPILILLFAAVGIGFYRIQVRSKQSLSAFTMDPVLLQLFLVCVQAGSLIFGTGIAIVPWLEGEFVGRLGWLTHSQFLDAVSFGQLTPGPMTISTAFIGFKMAGLTGALVATVAVFFPSFFHMVTWFPRLYSWLLQQKWIYYFSLTVTAAVAGTIVVVLFRLGHDWNRYHLFGIVALLALLRFTKIPSWGIILLGGLGSYLVSLMLGTI